MPSTLVNHSTTWATIYSLENPTASFLVAIALTCLITGLSKGGFGGTIGALSTPILTLFVPASAASGIVLPILLLGDVFSVTTYWRKWDLSILKRMLPPAALGIVLGTLYLNFAPANLAKTMLGLFCFAFAVYKIAESRLSPAAAYHPQNWHAPVSGFAAGTLSAIANAGGPPFSIYMLLRRLLPADFVATAALFFAAINVMKMPGYIALGIFRPAVLLEFFWLLPLIPIGVWIGRKIVGRINRQLFETIVLISLVLTGLLLIAG